jgi:hypothetical protein
VLAVEGLDVERVVEAGVDVLGCVGEVGGGVGEFADEGGVGAGAWAAARSSNSGRTETTEATGW